MGDGLTVFLEDFAQISNIGAIVVVVTCLASMAIYIYRISTENGGRSGLSLSQQTPVQMMSNVYNPFVITMYKPHTANIKDGVTLEVTNKISCTIHALWGVNIAHIYKVIHQPWEQFCEVFRSTDIHLVSNDKIQHSQTPIDLNCENHNTQVALTPPTGFDLGAPPREKYPLVVVLLDEEALKERSDKTDQVVAHISLIHVRDEHCPGESQVITQFVRTPNSTTVYNLQQLYVSGDALPAEDEDIDNEPTTGNDVPFSSGERQMCLICQSHPVSRVALPCRHACVCHVCFQRLHKCPMCRQHITSYFSINCHNYKDDDQSDHDDMGR